MDNLISSINSLVAEWPGTGNDMEGSGTEADPYIIMNANDLDNVRNNLSAHYRVGADMSFAQALLNPDCLKPRQIPPTPATLLCSRILIGHLFDRHLLKYLDSSKAVYQKLPFQQSPLLSVESCVCPQLVSDGCQSCA